MSISIFLPPPTHNQAPAAKRPKLQLTTNAKIPTKFRQRFLDSFIDEFLKTDPHPEQAYQKVPPFTSVVAKFKIFLISCSLAGSG